MTQEPFVRTEMLTEQPAPLGETGMLKWARENLFSSWLNTIVSLAFIAIAVNYILAFLGWAIQPSWESTSLRQCLDDPEINDLLHVGACWGVINERFIQLMFGFYPSELQWRPTLAFLLMFVAIGPVLFDRLPRKLLIFTALFPFLAIWLLWGGTVWAPLLTLAGVLIGYFVLKGLSSVIGDLGAMIIATLATILWWMFAVTPIDAYITKTIAEPNIAETITALEQNEGALVEAVAEMEGRIAALEAPIAALQEPIKALKNDVEEANAVVDGLQEQLSADLQKDGISIRGFYLWSWQVHSELSESEVTQLEAELATAQSAQYNARLAYSDENKKLDAQVRILQAANTDVANAEISLRESERARTDMGALPQLLEDMAAKKAQMAELETAFGVLTTALPSNVVDVISAADLPRNTSDADREAFNIHADAKQALSDLDSDIASTQNRIVKAYELAGLVGLEPVESSKFGGLMLSITIGVAGIAFSFPLGIILALGRQSDMLIIKTLSVTYIEFIRGVPLITLLFTASVLLNYFLPPGTNFDIILRVVIMVTLFAAAYMAEVIRGGLAALPTGQYEAADALGLDYWKSMRLIIMPQALKISIPGIVGTFIGLFKDTTLVSIIGLLDPVGLVTSIRGDADWNGIVWELYVFIALMFWIFTFSMSRYSMYLENKLKTTH